MLVSHRYRFIFIKTVKTAGTSIEVELSKLMGPEDIVTEIVPPVEGHEPRNFVVNGVTLYNHMPARHLREVIGREVFDGYLKFCVEREPVDKCLSYYAMIRNSPDHNAGTRDLSWADFVASRKFPTDVGKYTSRTGRRLVDRILKYERLEAELGALMAELGVPFEGLRAQAKASYAKGGAPKPEVSEADRRAIYRAFRIARLYTGYRLRDARQTA